MENSEIINFLDTIKGKKVVIKNSGFIGSQATVKKFKYDINYQILTLSDEKSSNYTVLDLGKIKEVYINYDDWSLTAFFNDEIETEVLIRYNEFKQANLLL
ncbi:MAG: hypothetical protein IJV31_05605 [Clostridia bacterium]|nr:hypothetical protein [Clostridia bacterium]